MPARSPARPPVPVAGAYLDHAASTPMRPEAVEALGPYLSDVAGNPTGVHAPARAAKVALEEAREQVADQLGRHPSEIVWTGSGSESDNLAIKGAARAARDAGFGDGVVVSAIEHKAVLASADRLEREGFRVTRVGATPAGTVDLDALAAALDDRTVVVSVMLVNNEVGTVQPVSAVASLVQAAAPRAALHTDAVQAPPWLDLRAATAAADLVSLSGHKFGGPKGVGILTVPSGLALEPLVEGGGHELGHRAGTQNVAGAVAFARALSVLGARRDAERARIRARRDRLEQGLLTAVSGAVVTTPVDARVDGICHVAFPGVEAEALLVLADQAGVFAAAGSSCSSGATEPSHVLQAMGVSRAQGLASIRLSLGWSSTAEDVERALEVLPGAVARLRQAPDDRAVGEAVGSAAGPT